MFVPKGSKRAHVGYRKNAPLPTPFANPAKLFPARVLIVKVVSDKMRSLKPYVSAMAMRAPSALTASPFTLFVVATVVKPSVEPHADCRVMEFTAPLGARERSLQLGETESAEYKTPAGSGPAIAYGCAKLAAVPTPSRDARAPLPAKVLTSMAPVLPGAPPPHVSARMRPEYSVMYSVSPAQTI
jgi:hypothetical protein